MVFFSNFHSKEDLFNNIERDINQYMILKETNIPLLMEKIYDTPLFNNFKESNLKANF